MLLLVACSRPLNRRLEATALRRTSRRSFLQSRSRRGKSSNSIQRKRKTSRTSSCPKKFVPFLMRADDVIFAFCKVGYTFCLVHCDFVPINSWFKTRKPWVSGSTLFGPWYRAILTGTTRTCTMVDSAMYLNWFCYTGGWQRRWMARPGRSHWHNESGRHCGTQLDGW